jgi:autotransporter-associated beta strand protein
MKKKIICTLIGFGLCLAAQAADIFSRNVVGNVETDAVWNPAAPTSSDVAVWLLSGNGSKDNALGADVSWSGIRVDAGILRNITINTTGTGAITLGSAGIDMSANPTDVTRNLFTIKPNVILGASQTWNVAENANLNRNLQVDGIISGTAGNTLTKSGLGALTLTASNTYAGGTVFNAGTLNINNNTALGTGMFTINGGTITSTGNTFANNITINGDFSVIGNTGATTPKFNGNVSLGTASGTSRTITTVAANSGTGQLVFDGVISDGTTANKIIKKGSGGMVLSGANLFTGGFDLDEGTLFVNTGSAVGTGTLSISNGTTLSVSGVSARSLANQVAVKGDFTLGGVNKAKLTLSGDVDLGGAERKITIGNVLGDIISGVVSNGALNIEGVGPLTLSGANTYAGGTTVSSGSLFGASAGAFGTGGMTVADGATLILGNAATLDDLIDLVLGSSSVLQLDFTGADTVGSISLDGGLTTLAAGTYDASALTGLGDGTYTGTGSLTVIPEPATIGMLGLGALITMMLRRMRTR